MKLRAGCLGFVLCASVIAAASLTARPASAQQDDAVLQMARERFKEGVRYYDQKKYEEARAAFLQAYALKKHPAVLLNLAQSELHSGHTADAAKHFSQFLRENKETTPAERQDAEKGLSAAKTKVGEVAVSVDQDGAEVLVDGKPAGESPLGGPLYLLPGSHTIEAKKDGKSTSTSVAATAGQSTSASLSFGAGGSASSAGTTAAGPGQPGGTPPTGASPPPAGATSGGELNLSTQSRQPFFDWAAHNKLAWVGGGLTVVGLAGGIGFAISSNSAYSNADAVASQIAVAAQQDGLPTQGLCTTSTLESPQVSATGRATKYAQACKQYQDNVNTGDTQKTLSIAGFVVAGVAAAGTLVYYFVDTGHGHKTEGASTGVRAALVPVATPSEQGLTVIGRF